jgi:uncharacterized protein (DUF433 family)
MATKFPNLWRVDDICGGQAVLLKGTGIIADVVAGRFAAGDSIESIADDYRVDADLVLDAIRCIVGGAFGRTGLRVEVERKMFDAVPLTYRSTKPPRTQAVAKDGQKTQRPKKPVARRAGKQKTTSRSASQWAAKP